MKTLYKTTRIPLLITVSICWLLIISSCKKFIEVDPPVTSVNEGNIYEDDATAAAALTGVYTKMSNTLFSLDLTVYPELAADNLTLFDLTRVKYTSYWQNNLDAIDPLVPKFWIDIYPYIFNANSAITGISNSNKLTPDIKQHLLGEAYFIRAFCYSYLAALYGDVPLAVNTDYTKNNSLSRSPVTDVYRQIIDDLKQAKSLLTDGYLQSDALTLYSSDTEQRVRPNRWSATALLARAYLYSGDYANAEQTAGEVINNSTQYSLIPPDQVFLSNSKETIWAFKTVKDNVNTDEADLFILLDGGPNETGGRVIYLSDDLISSFESGDQRKTIWTAKSTDANNNAYHYAAKYKAVAGSTYGLEYPVALRLGEQYLIRAEARIQQNNIAGGIEDLNVLRDRAIDKNASQADRLKLLPLTLSKEEATKALLHERRVELFCEWGHRWYDLRRLGKIDPVMRIATLLKGGGEWESYKSLLPVPSDEIRANTAIVQNPGYTN